MVPSLFRNTLRRKPPAAASPEIHTPSSTPPSDEGPKAVLVPRSDRSRPLQPRHLPLDGPEPLRSERGTARTQRSACLAVDAPQLTERKPPPAVPQQPLTDHPFPRPAELSTVKSFSTRPCQPLPRAKPPEKLAEKVPPQKHTEKPPPPPSLPASDPPFATALKHGPPAPTLAEPQDPRALLTKADTPVSAPAKAPAVPPRPTLPASATELPRRGSRRESERDDSSWSTESFSPSDSQVPVSNWAPGPLMCEITQQARMRRLASGVIDKEYTAEIVNRSLLAQRDTIAVMEHLPTAQQQPVKKLNKMASSVACPGFQDQGAENELRQALQLRKLKTKQID